MDPQCNKKVNDAGEKFDYKYRETEIGMSIYMDNILAAGGSVEVRKSNKELCKNGSGKENQIQFKQNKIYGSKDRQRKGRRYRTSESWEHSKNQEIKTLGITINEEGNLKGHTEELKQV